MQRTTDRPLDAAMLKKVPLFAEFSDADLAAVSSLMQGRRYAKHAVLVYEGDPGDALFIVISGNVAVTRVSNDGKETILSILKEGDFFGEMGVLDASPRSATIKALRDAEVAILARKDFLDLLGRNPHMCLSLVGALSARLRATNQAIQANAYQDIRTRLASLLLNLERNFGEKVDGGTRLSLRLTNQEMANMIGTTRETVNRMLNKFWDEKLIDMRTANIVVVDHARLQAMLG
ncbi:MAG TPA: Crp/Fnr family transcriptional regulator [Candidatus Eremiobacteraceae bacterium]|nr:Crp/Fnr family transcriptional regulator [Candidatus Eremiobacteraceae bacterium]